MSYCSALLLLHFGISLEMSTIGCAAHDEPVCKMAPPLILSEKSCEKTFYLLKCQTWGNCENQNLLSAPEDQNLLSALERSKPSIYTSNEKWDFYGI